MHLDSRAGPLVDSKIRGRLAAVAWNIMVVRHLRQAPGSVVCLYVPSLLCPRAYPDRAYPGMP